MTIVILTCLVLLSLTTLIHFEVLQFLTLKLPFLHIPRRTKLIAVIFGAFLAHSVEIILYGLMFFLFVRYFSLGILSGHGGSSLLNCIYFSTETYTSLGFGDVIPGGPLRLLAGTEALNGLLLIGWSASYTYIAMERYWNIGVGTIQQNKLSDDLPH